MAIIWIGSLLLWALGGQGMWRYALLELFALVYFYRRWSSPEAQHRQLHFLLMCSYLTTTALYAYELAIRPIAPHAFGLSSQWFQLVSNLLFGGELLLIIGYAFLYRRARTDRRRYYADVEGLFTKAGAVKHGIGETVRNVLMRKEKP